VCMCVCVCVCVYIYIYIYIYICKTTLLPYFPQLAKVFSQGKYYVGGPQKVSICRNSLLTNTLIMRFCLLLIVVYHGLSTALV
jgi:hypothetical protein